MGKALELLDKLESLIEVPDVSESPEESLKGMEMLNLVVKLRGELMQGEPVCSCGSLNYGYGFAKCFACGKIKDV